MPYTNNPAERVAAYPEGHKRAGSAILAVLLPDDSGVLRSIYGRQTIEEIREQEREPGARIMTWDEFRAAAVAEQQKTPAIWVETTRAKFYEMLEVLPPIAWQGGSFLVGEPYDSDAATGAPRYHAFRETGAHGAEHIGTERYYTTTRAVTVKELIANRHTAPGVAWS